MSKSPWMRSVLMCLGLLGVGGARLLGAASDDYGVITFRGPETWAMATKAPIFITPAMMPSAELYTIYSNLGPKNDPYYAGDGYFVAGPGSQDEGQQWIGMPFTPKSDVEVTEIKIAMTYDYGPVNGGVVSLNETSRGFPGKALHRWNLKVLHAFGTCCTLEIAKNGKGLPLKKGKKYWVVASTNASETDTVDIWNWTHNQTTGPHAINTGSGWKTGVDNILSAFGVFGQKTE